METIRYLDGLALVRWLADHNAPDTLMAAARQAHKKHGPLVPVRCLESAPEKREAEAAGFSRPLGVEP